MQSRRGRGGGVSGGRVTAASRTVPADIRVVLQQTCWQFCASVPALPVIRSANGTVFRDYNAWIASLVAPDYATAWLDLVDFVRRCSSANVTLRQRLQTDVTRFIVEEKVRENCSPDQQKAPSTASLRQVPVDSGKLTFNAVLDVLIMLQDIKQRFLEKSDIGLDDVAQFGADVDIARLTETFVAKFSRIRNGHRRVNINIVNSGNWSRKFLGDGFQETIPNLPDVIRRIVRRSGAQGSLLPIILERLPEHPSDPLWADPVLHAVVLVNTGDHVRARRLLDHLKRPLMIGLESTLPDNERMRIEYCELAVQWARAQPNLTYQAWEIMLRFEHLVEMKEWPDSWTCDADTMEKLRQYSERDNFSALCTLANACIFATKPHGHGQEDLDVDGVEEFDDDDACAHVDTVTQSYFASGRELLKKSIDLGDVTAPVDMVTLLFMDLENEVLPNAAMSERVNEVIKYYQLGVDRQCPSSSAGLGKLFEAGYGDALLPDAAMAAQYYRSGLGTGKEAPFCLGELLEHGALGIDRDPEEALAWYRVAHRRGHCDAGTRIAAVLLDPRAHSGAGPSKSDVESATTALFESIEMGSADAMHFLGTLYHDGVVHLRANLEEARKLYVRAICLQLRHTHGVEEYHRTRDTECCDHGCRGGRRPSESGCRCATSIFNLGQIEFEMENYCGAANCFSRAHERGCTAAAENLASL
jgi:TPR repeat protein